MQGDSPQEKLADELHRQATAFAESLAKQALKCEVLGEVVNDQSLWTEFRLVFKQHLRLWQQFTTVTLAAAADGSLAGWLVESRKARCGPQALSDADVERFARTIKQIRRDLPLTSVKRMPLDDQRGMAIASFAGPAKTDACEVTINHSTGEVIGFMPTPVGKITPLPTDDAEAEKARELAWGQIEADLKVRLGVEVAAQARDVFKLIPQSALRDEAHRSFRVFKLWRFFSTADVSIEESAKEIVGWYVEAFKSDAPDRVITEAAAIQSSRQELKATQGVKGPRVSFERVGDAEKASVYWWHAEEGVNVEGDQTAVLVNATTGTPFSVWRKWRKISPELFKQATTTQEQALQAADRAVKRSPTGPRGQVLGKSVIQAASDPDQPGPVRDVLVWLVGYSENGGVGFTEVAVDCKNGEPVRITGW